MKQVLLGGAHGKKKKNEAGIRDERRDLPPFGIWIIGLCVYLSESCFIYKLHTHISHGTKKKNYIGSPQDFDNSFLNKSHVTPLGCRTVKD